MSLIARLTAQAKAKGDEEIARRNQEQATDNAMRSRLAAAEAKANASSFQPIKAEAMPTQAAANPMFQAMRNRLQSQGVAQNQQQQDALARRFARAGGLNSGAAIKTMQNAQAAHDAEQTERMQQVDLQEQAALRQDQEAAQGRNFQREMANVEGSFKDRVFHADNAKAFAGLDMALQEFFENRSLNRKNFDLAKKQADSTGGLFGGGGFLGLGL